MVAAAERFLASDVESIALCDFDSYVNTAREQAVAQRLRSLGVELPLSQSSHLAPVRPGDPKWNVYRARRPMFRREVPLGWP